MRAMSRLARIALSYVLVWLALSLVTMSQAYRIRVALGWESIPLLPILTLELGVGLLWAVFTPLVVAVGERLPFRTHPARAAVLLVTGVPLLALAHNALETAILPVGSNFHSAVFNVLVILALTRLVCAWNEARQRETRCRSSDGS